MKFLIVDDHAVIRRGLKQILLEEFPTAMIAEAEDAEIVISSCLSNDWDVVISDLSMPGRSGLDIVYAMKQNCPKVPVLILSIHAQEQYAYRAFKAGAAGYLSKGAAPEELVKAVQRVLQGRKYISSSLAEKLANELGNKNGNKEAHELLSDREFDVFTLLASGVSVSKIAETLSLSITTVSTYRSRILTKMDMKSNADLTRYAINKTLI